MKKLPLLCLALMGFGTVTLEAESPLFLAQAQEQYICSNYGNCGLCGGKCNIKNPNTPGLTPEQKREAEEYQRTHREEKEKKPSGCGAFEEDDSSAQAKATRASMKIKRNSRT